MGAHDDYQAVVAGWARAAAELGLAHQVLAPEPAPGRLARLRQKTGGSIHGPWQGDPVVGIDLARMGHLLVGAVDGIDTAVAAGTWFDPTSDVDNVSEWTIWRAEAPWLPPDVRVGHRDRKGLVKNTRGGSGGWSWVDAPATGATPLCLRAADEDAAVAWTTGERVSALAEAIAATPDLMLADGGVQVDANGLEDDPEVLVNRSRAVMRAARVLR